MTPTVLLLHAFPVDEGMWDAVLGRSTLDAVAPRLYGRGPSVDGWAEQLLGEVDGDVISVGASMGGYTAVVRSFAGPLVVCAGDRDELFSPGEGRAVAELAPSGRFELFAGAGHRSRSSSRNGSTRCSRRWSSRGRRDA